MTSDVAERVAGYARDAIDSVSAYIRGLTPTQRNLIIIAIAGLILRYAVGTVLTYPRDIASWIINTENFQMGEDIYSLPGHYYTPGWGYVMAILTAIASFTGMPISKYVSDFTGDTAALPWYTTLPTLEYALTIKTFLFIVDLLVAVVLYRIGLKTTGSEKWGVIMFAVWFLCPFTIIISAIRVMFENVEILFMLLSLYMMLSRRPAMAGAMMGISLMFKPYGIFLGILLIGYAFAQSQSFRYTGRYIAFAILAVTVLMLPVILTGGFDESMIWLTARSDNPTSGYNLTLLIMPALLLASVAGAAALMRWRITDFGVLACMALAITSGTLLLAGNVQYYLIILPLALLMASRLSILPIGMLLILAVFAGLSFMLWSSQLYISYDFWGSGALESFGEWLAPWESRLDYDYVKTYTGYIAMLLPLMILGWRLYMYWRSVNEE